MNGQFPLIRLLPNPSKNFNSLALHQVYFLSQIVSEDGLYLLSWNDLKSLLIVRRKGVCPSWYTALLGLVTVSPNSYKLRPEFWIDDKHLPFSSPSLVDTTASTHNTWITTISCRINRKILDPPPDESTLNSSDLIIGHTLRNAPFSEDILSHWYHYSRVLDANSTILRSTFWMIRLNTLPAKLHLRSSNLFIKLLLYFFFPHCFL